MVLAVATMACAAAAWGQRPENEQRPSDGERPGAADKQAKMKGGQRPGGGFAGGISFERIADRHDANKDEKVTREEWKGPAEFFDRMDRNGDGVITAADFKDGPAGTGASPGGQSDRQPGTPSAGQAGADAAALFRLLDADKDGKVSKDELEKLFRRADSDQDDSLSADELRKLLGQAEPAGPSANGRREPAGNPDQPAHAGRSQGPASSPPGTSPEKLQKILKEREGHLKPGDAAPDFKLKTLDGKGTVQLSQVIGKRPVVLIFGSYT